MASLPVVVKKVGQSRKKLVFEFDASQFEKLANLFGFFSQDALASIERAEKDYSAGRTRTLKSFKSLRTK